MSDFPGYLGWTSQGVIAIHADWPAYPAEHGWEVALSSLGIFPGGTEFAEVDDIDRCLLFLATPHSKYASNDLFDERNFHVAAWHEDLLELARRGFIRGATGVTELTWRLNQPRKRAGLASVNSSAEALEEDLPEEFFQLPSGEFRRVPRMSREYDDEEINWVLANEPLAITPAGWHELQKLLAARVAPPPPQLASRVRPLIELGQYDTVVREVSAALETMMRDHIQSEGFGTGLVEDFIAHLRESRGFVDAHLKILRIELLTAFKFERNFYAHRIVDVPSPQGLAMASRFFSLFQTVVLVCEATQ